MDSLMAKKNFKELADAIVTNIGGEGNVKMVTVSHVCALF